MIVLHSVAFGQTATTSSLTLNSGGSQISTVTAGSTVTLIASVTAASVPVKQGQVMFCDATALYCTDIHRLGMAQLNSSGQAQIHLRPGAGTYSYRALFLGTPGTAVPYAGSMSSTAMLSVTGKATTAATITPGGVSGDYTLTAFVYGFVKSQGLATPTGSVSFVDTTTNSTSLGVGNLSAVSGLGWMNINNPVVGNEPGSVVTGDFNNDGNLDLAVAINTQSTTVAILLGDGQGNFTPVTANPITAVGSPVLTQDFNQDGIPDLLLSSYPLGGTMTVLLGNGDGTFNVASGSPMSSNYGAFPLFVTDFNGDGILDIATSGGYYSTMWLGNGDGTFTEMPITSSTLLAVSGPVGDFNNDGYPDLVTLTGSEISVFLGKGDGTFKAAINTPANLNSSPFTVVEADFNNDGKLDLAVALYGSPSTVLVFLGSGDGTFTPAPGSPMQVGSWLHEIAVGDFNGDGVTDLLINATTSLTDIFILLGSGDGRFTPAGTGSLRLPCCFQTAIGDFNGDGVSDIVSPDFYSGTADVFLTGAKQSSAEITGIAVHGQSPQNVIASYPGDSNYRSSDSSPTALLVQASAPVFAPASGGVIALGQTITLTSSTPGVSLYYQASGALQTNGWVSYSAPISFYNTGSVTIQAYAASLDYGQSAITTATYTVIATNPVPALNTVSPAFATAGHQGFTFALTGSGFTSLSAIYWGMTAVSTQFNSPTQLTGQVTSAEIAIAGVQSISVQNPMPGGGTSNVLKFEVDSGGGSPPSLTTTSATISAGSSATYSVTLPSSAMNPAVNCLNLPAGASCTYSASSQTLTITTSNSTPLGTYQITAVFTETLAGPFVAFAPLLFLPLGVAVKKRRTGWRLCLWSLIVGCLALFTSGCGGSGGSVSQPPTHQVTTSAIVTLTVQ